jgi:rubrerythrin
MEKEHDWRVNNQERYLKGKAFVKKRYTAASPIWDHDHCAFCWTKLTENEEPGTIQEGYATEDNKDWVCPQCFADFQAEFEWTIREG